MYCLVDKWGNLQHNKSVHIFLLWMATVGMEMLLLTAPMSVLLLHGHPGVLIQLKTLNYGNSNSLYNLLHL